MTNRSRILTVLALLLPTTTAHALDEPRAARLKLRSVQFETADIHVLSPGRLKKQPYVMSLEESTFLQDSVYYTFSKLPEVEVAVSWIRAREGFPADLDGGAEAFVAGQTAETGVVELEYRTQDATVSGLPAVRVSTTYTQNGQRATESVFFGKNNEAWQVTVFVPLRDKEMALQIIESVAVRAQVADKPELTSRHIERSRIRVTLEGEFYINGKSASFKEVKKELRRLKAANGVVLYYREGGESPPRAAELASGRIMFEIGRMDLPLVWSEDIGERQHVGDRSSVFGRRAVLGNQDGVRYCPARDLLECPKTARCCPSGYRFLCPPAGSDIYGTCFDDVSKALDRCGGTFERCREE